MSDYIPDHLKYQRIKDLESQVDALTEERDAAEQKYKLLEKGKLLPEVLRERDSLRARLTAAEKVVEAARDAAQQDAKCIYPHDFTELHKALADYDKFQKT